MRASTTAAAPRIVIGASHAGVELALRLRQLDPDVPVLLLGDEPVLPYQRPPLSKSWLGDPAATPEALFMRPAETYAQAGVTVRSGARVARIERDARQVVLSTGEVLPYSQLALATGARARRLGGPQAEAMERAPNLHCLRTLADAERLRPQFVAGARLTIVGGGYIGLELAALAVQCGLRPTVIEAQPRVLARVAPPALSAFYESVHRDAGVKLLTGVQVDSFGFSADGRIDAVFWRDAAGHEGRLPTDVVVIGVGVLPEIELALAAGLVCDDGIVVDACCRTADPFIVAAGDCTSRPVPGHEGRMRIESVPNALEQARTAAATLCGQHQPCLGVPWFWSNQYDLKLQMVGISRGHDTVVVRGDMQSRAFTVFYLRQGRLLAADAVNRPAEFMLARKLVTDETPVDPDLLTDTAFDLKGLTMNRIPG
ncbi:MAG: FAD-dependent oxidoreductase [Hydrogenophaga sp.]|nr:FAD-dependent oxidoreductase [Hydrogenophaga sp.]